MDIFNFIDITLPKEFYVGLLCFAITGMIITAYLMLNLYYTDKLINEFKNGKTVSYEKSKNKFFEISIKNGWVLEKRNFVKKDICLNVDKEPTKWYFTEKKRK